MGPQYWRPSTITEKMLDFSCLGCRLPPLLKLDTIEYASVITIRVGGILIPVGTGGSGIIACSCVEFDTVFNSLMVDHIADTN